MVSMVFVSSMGPNGDSRAFFLRLFFNRARTPVHKWQAQTVLESMGAAL
jgi:hypothetical protein